MQRLLLFLTLIFSILACKDFDSTKIIAPTDFQIEAVSMSLSTNVHPTNVAAQKLEDDKQYTLVGATLRHRGKEMVGIWLFDENDSSAIKSINETAQAYSPFPMQSKLQVTNEARNLSAFLLR